MTSYRKFTNKRQEIVTQLQQNGTGPEYVFHSVENRCRDGDV